MILLHWKSECEEKETIIWQIREHRWYEKPWSHNMSSTWHNHDDNHAHQHVINIKTHQHDIITMTITHINMSSTWHVTMTITTIYANIMTTSWQHHDIITIMTASWHKSRSRWQHYALETAMPGGRRPILSFPSNIQPKNQSRPNPINFKRRQKPTRRNY